MLALFITMQPCQYLICCKTFLIPTSISHYFILIFLLLHFFWLLRFRSLSSSLDPSPLYFCYWKTPMLFCYPSYILAFLHSKPCVHIQVRFVKDHLKILSGMFPVLSHNQKGFEGVFSNQIKTSKILFAGRNLYHLILCCFWT